MRQRQRQRQRQRTEGGRGEVDEGQETSVSSLLETVQAVKKAARRRRGSPHTPLSSHRGCRAAPVPRAATGCRGTSCSSTSSSTRSSSPSARVHFRFAVVERAGTQSNRVAQVAHVRNCSCARARKQHTQQKGLFHHSKDRGSQAVWGSPIGSSDQPVTRSRSAPHTHIPR